MMVNKEIHQQLAASTYALLELLACDDPLTAGIGCQPMRVRLDACAADTFSLTFSLWG